ncbi:MAG TPA: hypothetical protein VHF24_06455 [Acidimicrobiales bacterium]|nr:hypothetical protein [Acidimicrobiales bacterium]
MVIPVRRGSGPELIGGGRIVISDFMSLDGVVQAPGGRNEDTDRGFEHGGWSMRYFDPDAMGVAIDEAMATTDALLFGRGTWRRGPTNGLPSLLKRMRGDWRPSAPGRR